MNYLFASAHLGTEKILERELLCLGGKNLQIIKGGIYFQANELILYQTLMWSRIASRIFLSIKTFKIKNDDDLYQNTYQINWSEIFDVKNSFIIDFQGTNKVIRNSLFGSFRIKDAIVDQFNKNYSFRPNVNLINPDIRIKVCLSNNSIIHIMLDLSGNALHKRGYRQSFHISPIKENLAAAIVFLSGWEKGIPIIDPMCGSGTLLIEAAMIASDRAPGLARIEWGFKNWKKYNPEIWENVFYQAQKRFKKGKKLCGKNYFIGHDYNIDIITKAKNNALNANVLDLIDFSCLNLNDFNNIYHKKNIGIILTNPPYGERCSTKNQLVALYVQLGITMKNNFQGWKLSILTSSSFLETFLQLKSYEEFLLKNGPLSCIQKNYKIFPKNIKNHNNEYKNRLKKNFKKLKKWADLENIECFRIYHSDLPNYNIIVDIYKTWVVIQEYQAPKYINYNLSHKRLCNAIYDTKEVLSVSINNIIFKIRQKHNRNTQYQKLFNSNSFFLIQEYYVKFLVNIIDYLDTGLFSEKRLIRKLLGQISKNKDFLNLFGYTGTASVYAGLGQAKSTTTVDISKTYIGWSMRNMSINNLIGSQHYFIQSDCIDWVKKTDKKFDLIFVNPPTFSNSKKMKKNFELKRDYLNLISDLKKILQHDGYIIFSSSTYNFKINFKDLSAIKLHARDITKKTQTKDYLNHKNGYYSWLIKHIQ